MKKKNNEEFVVLGQILVGPILDRTNPRQTNPRQDIS